MNQWEQVKEYLTKRGFTVTENFGKGDSNIEYMAKKGKYYTFINKYVYLNMKPKERENYLNSLVQVMEEEYEQSTKDELPQH